MSKKILNKRIRRGSNSASGFLPYEKGDLNMALGREATALNQPNLFRTVDSSITGYFVATLLCLSFFLQGFNYASADTSDAADVTTQNIEPAILVDDSSEDLPTEITAESVQEGSTTYDDETGQDQQVDQSTSIVTEQESESMTDGADLQLDDSGNTEAETSYTEEGEILDISYEDEEEVGGGSDSGSATGSDTDEDGGENINDEENDSVEEDTPQSEEENINEIIEEELVGSTESISIVQSDTAYTFNREECTLLATGSYYCLKPVEGVLDDALFAAPDEDGDLEIFLVREGVQSQVTANQVDDAAPYFDINSNTIVWHRLINDRYQIVSYDIDSGEENILTGTSENNMEPTRQGDYTVWQRWVGGSWNIMLHDGRREIRVSNGGGHNVAPYVHGSLVVWNRHSGDGQKTIEMYDIESRSYVSVPDAEGLSVSNPRMVFVFDSLTPEGDVVTKGYDVLSRKFIDLASLPKELPDEIPHSDSTGETRALIQSKPSIKSELEELIESEPDIITPEPEIEDNTLDLTEFATSSEPQLNTEYDLVIEPYNAELSASSSEQTGS